MKGTNQFDYPTAMATNYKAYREQIVTKEDKKGHYKRVIKIQSHNERERVKNEQQRKKEQQAIEQQNRIREQIQRKKRQLQQLQRKKQEAMQNERQAFELAKIKLEQQKIKRIEEDKKWEQNNQNANFRFRDALRRLQAEKQEKSYKERQAMQRRKVAQDVERQQREKAIKYKAYLQQKEEQEKAQALQQQKRNEQLYRNGIMRHGLAKNIDYSKTCFHNPKLVFKYDHQQQQTSAFKKAEEEQRRQKQLSVQKRQRVQQNRKKSVERGQKALQRIYSQRQYEQYCSQAQKEQREYNLQRVQVGKKNQYIGLKPLTLNQIEVNKKLRSEEQFQQMFVKSSSLPIQQIASKYTIMETKYNPVPQNNYSKWRQTQQDQDSLEVYNPPSAYHQYVLDDDSLNNDPEVKPVPQSIDTSKQMAQTRIGNQKNYKKEELSYSQSEDDSSLHD